MTAGYTGDDEFSNERDRGEAILEATAESIPDGVTVETALEAGDPARTIVSYADDHDCSQIVIGSHGRDGLARFLLGSVAETVVRRSAVPRKALDKCGTLEVDWRSLRVDLCHT